MSKPCPFCAEPIQDAAVVCRFCRADLVAHTAGSAPVIVQTGPPVPAWNPGVAAVLSLVFPGAGQLYQGHMLAGLVWFMFVVVGYIALVLPGLALHLCCVLSAGLETPPAATVQSWNTREPPTLSATDMARAHRSRRRTGILVLGLAAAWVFMMSLGWSRLSDVTERATSTTPAAADPAWNDRLRTIVASTDQSCRDVVAAFHQGTDPKSQMNFWSVQCAGGAAYSIGFETGRAPRVLNCGTLQSVARVDCFKTFDEQRAR